MEKYFFICIKVTRVVQIDNTTYTYHVCFLYLFFSTVVDCSTTIKSKNNSNVLYFLIGSLLVYVVLRNQRFWEQ